MATILQPSEYQSVIVVSPIAERTLSNDQVLSLEFYSSVRETRRPGFRVIQDGGFLASFNNVDDAAAYFNSIILADNG